MFEASAESSRADPAPLVQSKRRPGGRTSAVTFLVPILTGLLYVLFRHLF